MCDQILLPSHRRREIPARAVFIRNGRLGKGASLGACVALTSATGTASRWSSSRSNYNNHRPKGHCQLALRTCSDPLSRIEANEKIRRSLQGSHVTLPLQDPPRPPSTASWEGSGLGGLRRAGGAKTEPTWKCFQDPSRERPSASSGGPTWCRDAVK